MKNCMLLGVMLMLGSIIYAQGVSINQTGNSADASAILDVSDTTMGLLIPRMTQNQRNGIATPSTSLLIYQTDQDSGFYYYDGTNWTPFLIGGAVANAGWSITGNAGTSPTTNFIGTTDLVDWVVRTNNNERLRVTANGNVGVGTNSPSSKLEVGAACCDATNIEINDFAYFGGGESGGVPIIGHNAKAVVASANRMDVANTHLLSGYAAIRVGGSPSDPDATGYGAISFYNASGSVTAGTNITNPSMIIKDDGNVGIGTTTPAHELHVVGDIHADGGSFLGESANTAAVPNFSFRGDENTGMYRATGDAIGFSTGGTEKVRVNSVGNVGIGLSNPGSKLDVSGDIELSGKLTDNDQVTSYLLLDDNRSPSSEVSLSAVNNLNILLDANNNTTTAAFRVYRNTDNPTTATEIFRVREDGNVGIGTTTPSHLLHVTGVARSTQTTWATTSDKRVKTNINNLKEGLDEVMKIRPVEFEYTKKYQKFNKGYDGLKRGFIAQEIKEIIPEMVTVMEEKIGDDTIKDFHLLSNSDFTPILIKAIQEQQQIIEDLKKDNETLRVEALTVNQRLKKLEELMGVKAEK